MSDEFVEIPKSRLSLLEGTAKLAQEIWGDEKVGMAVKERYKEMHPEANIPEVVVAQSSRRVEQELLSKVEAKEKALEDRISAFEANQKARDEADSNRVAEAEFARDVEATKKKYQLTDEGMSKVFDRMKTKNNPDVEAAAAWVTDHEVKAAPVTNSSYAPQDMNLYGSSQGDTEWAELNKNPVKYGDRVLGEMVNDFANGNFSRYKEFGGDL